MKVQKSSQKTLKLEIDFFIKKLPPIKQMEALDFIRWLWKDFDKKEDFTKEEISKIESLAEKKGGARFKNWKAARQYLESLM